MQTKSEALEKKISLFEKRLGKLQDIRFFLTAIKDLRGYESCLEYLQFFLDSTSNSLIVEDEEFKVRRLQGILKTVNFLKDLPERIQREIKKTEEVLRTLETQVGTERT